MGYDAPREVAAEQSTFMPEGIDDDDKLRDKYVRASEIALCYLWDSWKFHDYQKFLESQKSENAIPDLAPNGTKYLRVDVEGLESKGYSRTEAIAILEQEPKYNFIIDWEHYPPNELEMVGTMMDHTIFGEEMYKFVFEREIKFKRINSLMYDKYVVHAYKKPWPSTDEDEYSYVAKVSYYYHSASKYIMRYCNLFNSVGQELIDQTHIDEYMLDFNRKEV